MTALASVEVGEPILDSPYDEPSRWWKLEAQPMFRRTSASYVAIPEEQEPTDEVDRLFGLT